MTAKGQVVLVQIEEHSVDLVLVQLQCLLVEAGDAVQSSYAHLIYFVVEHVNEES